MINQCSSLCTNICKKISSNKSSIDNIISCVRYKISKNLASAVLITRLVLFLQINTFIIPSWLQV